MLYRLVVMLLVLILVMVGFSEPVYAYPNNSSNVPVLPYTILNQGDNVHITIHQGDNSSVYFNYLNNLPEKSTKTSAKSIAESTETVILNTSKNNASSGAWKTIGDGVLTTTGAVIGGAVVCLALDGAATVFFPPAAALAPFCAPF